MTAWKMNRTDLNELAIKAQADPDAKNELLIITLKEVLTPLANRNLSRYLRCFIDPDDLAAETLSRVIEDFNRYNPARCAWVGFVCLCFKFTISKLNRHYSWGKRQGQKDNVSIEDVSPKSVLPDTASLLHQDILTLLSPREKEAYELMLYGENCESSAQIMGISIKAAYNTRYQIRKKIKEYLKS